MHVTDTKTSTVPTPRIWLILWTEQLLELKQHRERLYEFNYQSTLLTEYSEFTRIISVRRRLHTISDCINCKMFAINLKCHTI